MKHFLTGFFLFEIRYRKYCIAAVVICLLLSLIPVFKASYTTDMFLLFPERSESRNNLNAIMKSGMLNRVTVYFSRKDGQPFSDFKVLSFLKKSAAELKKDPRIHDVLYSPDNISVAGAVPEMIRFIPQYMPPEKLPDTAQMEKILQDGFNRLIFNPFALSDMLRNDPFSFTMPYFRKLEEMMQIYSFRFAPDTPYLVSPDKRFAMMVILTDVTAADYRACQKLLDLIHSVLSPSQAEKAGLRTEIFSAHTHTLDNQQGITRDLKIFAITTVIIFTLLFAVVYRFDWRGFLIPVIPGIATVFATALMAMLIKDIQVFTLGIGGVLIGLGGDYGIHLYAASLSKRGIRKGVEMLPGLFYAFLTTSLAFFCFIFTGVPAFTQFGIFAFFSLLFTFVLMILLLPGLLFKKDKKHQSMDFYKYLCFRPPYKLSLLLLGVIILVLFIGCGITKFDPDIRKFDISFNMNGGREKLCQQAFAGGQQPVLLLYHGKSEDELFAKMRKDQAILRKEIPANELVSGTDFFMERSLREKNLAKWKSFLQSEKWILFQKQFLLRARKAGFEKEFFQPFFKNLTDGIGQDADQTPQLLTFAKRSMFSENENGFYGIAMADLRHDKVLRQKSSAIVLSEKSVLNGMFRDITGNLPQLIPWIIILILCIMGIFLRSLKKILLSFFPMYFSLLAIIGLHGLAGMNVTLAVGVSCIITVGISVDYGLLLISERSQDFQGIFNAVTFSAITTAAGGMTVIFTQHPMLRAAGLTIIAGILAAWSVSVYIILPFLQKKHSGKTSGLIVICIFALTLFSGCTYKPFGEQQYESLPENIKISDPVSKSGAFQATAVVDYYFGSVTFLLAGEVTPEKCVIYGMNPAGFRLFELEGNRKGLLHYKWQKAIISGEQEKRISNFLYDAISSFFYIPELSEPFQQRKMQKDVLQLNAKICGKGIYAVYYSGKKPQMMKITCDTEKKDWEIRIYPEQIRGEIPYTYESGTLLRAGIRLTVF